MLAAIAGFGIYYLIPQDKNRNITTPPTHAASVAEEKHLPSSFALDIPIPLPEVASNENFKLQEFNGLADGPRECSNQRGIRSNCYTTKYQYSITSGPADISPGASGDIKISVPVFVSGKGSQQGRAGDRARSDDIRYFQSKLIASANISVTMDSRWCPEVDIKPDFVWTGPTRVEIFHRAKVDIQHQVEEILRTPVTALGKDSMKNFTGCDKVQSALANIWKNTSFPVSKADGASEQFIIIKPKSLGYYGLKLASGNLYMGFSITADTWISDQQVKSEPRQLPQPIKLSSGSGRASVSVPIEIDYQYILQSINAELGKKPFNTRNRWGSFTIRVNKLRVYPSNDELVLGLHLHMQNSGSWKDTYGWVFLATTPRMNDSGTGVQLTKPVFTRPVDLKEWVTIKRALNESIVRKINRQGLVINFSRESLHLLENLKHDMEKSGPGNLARFSNATFINDNLSLLASGIRVNGSLSAQASFVADTSTERLVMMEASAIDAPEKSQIESSNEIQQKIDGLLNQMDTIEKKLGRFRQILNN